MLFDNLIVLQSYWDVAEIRKLSNQDGGKRTKSWFGLKDKIKSIGHLHKPI